MTLFRISALALFATGCFPTTDTATTDAADTDTDTDSDTDSDSDTDTDTDTDTDADADADTGTAYLTWTGDMAYDGSSVVVNYGFGAVNLATNENVCWMTAEHSGSDAGPSGCPDCDYSFGTTPTGDGTGGDYCDSFAVDTLFTYYSVSDFWFSTDSVKGWGFADSYTYTYSGTDYDLTQTIFMYYDDGADFHQWLFRHYNFPAGGIYNVEGDMNASSWNPIIDEAYYYYFYY